MAKKTDNGKAALAFGDPMGDRGDRYWIMSRREPCSHVSSLRESARDRKPMTREEAIKRFDDQIGNPDLVLVEVRIVAEKQLTDAPMKLVVR